MDINIRNYFNDQVLSEAAACFELGIPELTELAGFENFIYEFEQDGKAYILRITHISRRTREKIDAEMHWIAYLHANGVNCSLPLKSKQGNLVEAVGSNEHSFVVCAFDRVPGCRITTELDTRQLRLNYGLQVGRMHRLTKDYQAGATKRIDWFEDDLVKGFDTIVPPEDTLIMARMRENTAAIKAMPTNRDNFGLVHYDVHHGNFFVHNAEIYMFDFDDSQYAFFAADIAIVLFYFAGRCPKDSSREDFVREFYRDFMQGYVSENTLPADELAKIPIFLKQRELMLYAALLQAYRGVDMDERLASYLSSRKERLEQGLPFLEMIF